MCCCRRKWCHTVSEASAAGRVQQQPDGGGDCISQQDLQLLLISVILILHGIQFQWRCEFYYTQTHHVCTLKPQYLRKSTFNTTFIAMHPLVADLIYWVVIGCPQDSDGTPCKTVKQLPGRGSSAHRESSGGVTNHRTQCHTTSTPTDNKGGKVGSAWRSQSQPLKNSYCTYKCLELLWPEHYNTVGT